MLSLSRFQTLGTSLDCFITHLKISLYYNRSRLTQFFQGLKNAQNLDRCPSRIKTNPDFGRSDFGHFLYQVNFKPKNILPWVSFSWIVFLSGDWQIEKVYSIPFFKKLVQRKLLSDRLHLKPALFNKERDSKICSFVIFISCCCCWCCWLGNTFFKQNDVLTCKFIHGTTFEHKSIDNFVL